MTAARPAVLRRALGAWTLALAPLLAALPAPAGAQAAMPAAAPAAPATHSRLDDILARGVLRLGTPGDYAPFSLRLGQTDTWVGLDIELASSLARSLGVRLQVVPTRWSALLPDLLADRFDIAMGGVSVTLDRQREAMYSLPYLRDGKTSIARCGDVSRYQTLAQIDQPGVRLVENPGGTNERFARAWAPHARLQVWPDNVTVFDEIVAGRADVMITDAVEARLQARLHPQLCAIHPEAPFDFSEKAALLPRDPVWKAYVDEWMHQEIETGRLRAANERWLAWPWGAEALREAIEQRLQLSADVARWKWNHHADIEDAARERQVLDRVDAQAAALGVPRAFADAFFRAQIEASKTVQRELFMGWEVMKVGQVDGAPDLATVTRPRLDAVTARMLTALAANWPRLADPQERPRVVAALQPIEAESLSVKAVQQALAPLAGPAVAGTRAGSAAVPAPASAPAQRPAGAEGSSIAR